MDQSPNDLTEILAAWDLAAPRTAEIVSGHINRTFRVEHARGKLILQRVNPIFSPQVQEDIEAVTAHLAARGVVTPRLVRTRAGGLFATAADGGVWRMLTFIEGETLLVADSPGRCREAGRLLGVWHRALWDLDHAFQSLRVGVHDTPRHLQNLEDALVRHSTHPCLALVSGVAQEILSRARAGDSIKALPARAVHGDPKISNVLFSPDGSALCLLDLDTLSRLPLAFELGDAFRSWCSPGGEENERASFCLDFFEAGLGGYAGVLRDRPAPEETSAIPVLIHSIALELSARFCEDALDEKYFRWDKARFPSACQHNLLRARSQLALAASIESQLPALERINRSAWD